MSNRIGVNRRNISREKAGERKSKIRSFILRVFRLLVLGMFLLVLTGVAWFGIRHVWNKIDASKYCVIDRVIVVRDRTPNNPHDGERIAWVKGQSLFAFESRKVKTVFKNDADIVKVSLLRRFPHTLMVRLREREPVALAHLGAIMLVDRTGTLFPLGRGRFYRFPLLAGTIDTVHLSGIARIEKETHDRIMYVLSVLNSQAPELSSRITQIIFNRDGTVRFALGGGNLNARLDETTLVDGLKRLEGIMDFAGPELYEKKKTIDLCYNNLAYVR